MENNYLFFDAEKYASNLRCTIQKTGKIGFSDYTQKKLNINESMSIQIGIDGTKEDFSSLLLKLLYSIEKNAFRISKAGNYYYFNPKPLLDDLGINYKEKSIIYEMINISEENHIYKLVKKERKEVEK